MREALAAAAARRSAPRSPQLRKFPLGIAYPSAALNDYKTTRISARPPRTLITVIESVAVVGAFNWEVSDFPYAAPGSSRLLYPRLTRPYRPSSSCPTTSGGEYHGSAWKRPARHTPGLSNSVHEGNQGWKGHEAEEGCSWLQDDPVQRQEGALLGTIVVRSAISRRY